MPEQYAVALIVPPFRQAGDRSVVEWPREPSRPHEKVILVDGPHDELRDAQLAFLRRIGAL